MSQPKQNSLVDTSECDVCNFFKGGSIYRPEGLRYCKKHMSQPLSTDTQEVTDWAVHKLALDLAGDMSPSRIERKVQALLASQKQELIRKVEEMLKDEEPMDEAFYEEVSAQNRVRADLRAKLQELGKEV